MHISGIKIKNYRGLDVDIDKVDNIVMLIGQNDSGKTNICNAILKVLDYKKRKIPFLEYDSTNRNREKILIEIKLTIDKLTNEQLGIIGCYIQTKDSEKYIIARLESSFNLDTMEYEDTLIYGDPNGDYDEIKLSSQSKLDQVLSIIYIKPAYDFEIATKNYFSFKEKANKENDLFFTSEVSEAISNLNNKISEEEITKNIQNEINDLGDFKELFDDISFKVEPELKETNIYSSLNIIPEKRNYGDIENIGDGKNKIITAILKTKVIPNDKVKIYLVEEPENHLYVLLQKLYISSLLTLKPSQLIFTTHSPYTVDFEKIHQIIKIKVSENQRRELFSINNINNEDFKKFGYLINVNIAEMLFYHRVLLVEGSSEKYFYSFLMSSDRDFLNLIWEKRLGICQIDGVAFKTTKKLLEKLGIIVYVKTDNDIFQVPYKKNYRYAGLERCISMLDETQLQELNQIIELNDSNLRFEERKKKNRDVEDKMKDICNFFLKHRIILSKHNDGFEKDLIDYLHMMDSSIDTKGLMQYLKKAKLKNLHSFFFEHNINLKITDKTKKSVLISFLYE